MDMMRRFQHLECSKELAREH